MPVCVSAIRPPSAPSPIAAVGAAGASLLSTTVVPAEPDVAKRGVTLGFLQNLLSAK